VYGTSVERGVLMLNLTPVNQAPVNQAPVNQERKVA